MHLSRVVLSLLLAIALLLPSASAGAQDTQVLPDPGNVSQWRGQSGTILKFKVIGTASGEVWGNGTYTDDSLLAAAAVHAGQLRAGETGTVTVMILDGLAAYEGSVSNGVVTESYAAWEGSFRFISESQDESEPKVVGAKPAAGSSSGSTPNFGFAVRAESGLNLVISGYDGAGKELFSVTVNRRETYGGNPHYVVRVDETIIVSNTLSKWCVEDRSGNWTALPDGATKLCDEKPTDNRGTFVFGAPRAVVHDGAPTETSTSDAEGEVPDEGPSANAQLPSQNEPVGASEWRWGKNEQGLCIAQGVPVAKDSRMPRDAEPYLFIVNAVSGNPDHFGINLGTPPAGSQFYVMIDGYAYPVQPTGKVLIPSARSASAAGALLNFSYSALRHAGKTMTLAMRTGKELVLEVIVRDGPNAGSIYRDVYDLDGFALAKDAADRGCEGVAEAQVAAGIGDDAPERLVEVSSPAATPIECVQQELRALGFSKDDPTGKLDKKTIAAAKVARDQLLKGGWGLPPLDEKTLKSWCLLLAHGPAPALASIAQQIADKTTIRFGLDADRTNMPTIVFMASGIPLLRLTSSDLEEEEVEGRTLHLATIPYSKVRDMNDVCFEAPKGFDLIDRDGTRHNSFYCSGPLYAVFLASLARDWRVLKVVKEQSQ